MEKCSYGDVFLRKGTFHWRLLWRLCTYPRSYHFLCSPLLYVDPAPNWCFAAWRRRLTFLVVQAYGWWILPALCVWGKIYFILFFKGVSWQFFSTLKILLLCLLFVFLMENCCHFYVCSSVCNMSFFVWLPFRFSLFHWFKAIWLCCDLT